MNNGTPIVTACDQAYLPGLKALLHSIQNHEPGRKIYVLDCGISEVDLALLLRSFPSLETRAIVQPRGLPIPSVGSRATYARLLIGDLFPEYERILYLDADTVVVSPLHELALVSLAAPHIVAACVEPYTPTFGAINGVRDHRELGFRAAEPYFNAGVLLIDIMRWNCVGIKETALSYLRRTDIHIELFDQEALNVALAGRWRELAPEWNVSRYWMGEERRARRPNILQDARIVHFLSPEKPWTSPNAVNPWLLEKYERYAQDL